MQESASGLFSNSNESILQLANRLKNGTENIKNLPKIKVWQDKQGRVWSTNHRRLIAMVLAGIQQVPIEWASKATVLKNAYEFTTNNEGRRITVWLTDNVGMVVVNDGKCNRH